MDECIQRVSAVLCNCYKVKGKRNVVGSSYISSSEGEGREKVEERKKERVKAKGLVKTKILNFLPFIQKDATRI